MIAPHLEEMDKTMDDVVFLKVDVDDCEDIAAEYNVRERHKVKDCFEIIKTHHRSSLQFDQI